MKSIHPLHRMPADRRASRLQRSRGFTLVEVMIVVVMIGLLAALTIKGVPWAINAAKAVVIKGKASMLVTQIATATSHMSRIPITEDPVDPSEQLPASDSATADLTYDQVTAYELLAARELLTERPMFGFGRNPTALFDPSIVDYNGATQRFVAAADAASRTNYTTGGYNRIETFRVTDSAVDPATANGTNFFLHEAGVGLPVGSVVWVLVMTDLTANQAAALAKWYNEDDVNARTGLAQSLGKVAYSTASLTTNTVTAYVYLTHNY